MHRNGRNELGVGVIERVQVLLWLMHRDGLGVGVIERV
jgi:hypothetical protein